MNNITFTAETRRRGAKSNMYRYLFFFHLLVFSVCLGVSAVNTKAQIAVKGETVWTMAGEPPKKGGILAALRRSPLVGADLKLARSHEAGRKVDL